MRHRTTKKTVTPMRAPAFLLVPLLLLCSCAMPVSAPAPNIARIDHFVSVRSPAPGLAGAPSRLYVREVALAGGSSPIAAPDRVVLFIHGSGTPAEVSFDVPFADYSWMAYLAREGFDTFSLSLTGYGGSTRPAAMDDRCNLSKAQQDQLAASMPAVTCAARSSAAISTMDSDWAEIDAVVEHLRKLRGVDKVALVAWSQGGPRSAGYAARNPDKVSRIFALAPSYVRDMPAADAAVLPGAPMSIQSHKDFVANWDRQVGCKDQYEPAASDAVWSAMLASDPAGAQWGPGVRRAPNVNSYGFNRALAAKMQTPYAMATGAHDKQVAPERVRALYEDLAAKDKLLVELACSSHNAMWERNHRLLFKASADWLKTGRIEGLSRGVVKLGD